MRLKISKRAILTSLALLLIFSVSPAKAFAANFTFYPSSGTAVKNQEFIVDVLIDTEDADTLQAKAVITFDPTLITVVSADRNNTLYSTYPDAEQSIDNTNGVVMITGFTQSGTGTLYKTVGDPDVFVRLTFKALKTGVVTLGWAFDGTQAQFKSNIIADGSPATNVLLSAPASASYTITAGTITTPPPDTGIFDSSGLIIGGGVLLASIAIFAGFTIYSQASKKFISSKQKTIVIYD